MAMELIPETPDIDRYLEMTDVVDMCDAGVRQLADSLAPGACDDTAKVGAVFYFMQQNIPHTFNIDRQEVACKASDVLRYGHGICYAKALLVAALLRDMKVPAGFCYQRFRMEGTADSKFVLHCLNAIYLRDKGGWARIDVRNIEEGFDPTFRPGIDSGVFPVDASLGETDYPEVFVRPHPGTIEALKASKDALELHDLLPQDL
jgi:hypothetical protein